MLCGDWKPSFSYFTAVEETLLSGHRTFGLDLWDSMSVLHFLQIRTYVKNVKQYEAQIGRKDFTANRILYK